MLDLRSIFDRHHIPWKDKGSNCSRGNVNISCPFCGNDPSYHCSVCEDGSGYFCFRNRKHQGALAYLFNKLKIPLRYLKGVSSSYTPAEYEGLDVSAFQFFEPAENSEECIEYLFARNFLNPVEVCQRFNLKYSPEGRWAGRLIIPLTAGWTARSMRSHLNPRYLAHTDETGIFVFGKSSSAVLMEGAIDGMRIASSSSQFTVIATGGLGRIVSPSVILYLQQRNFSSLYLLEDNGTPRYQVTSDLRELKSYLTSTQVKSIQVPKTFKDPAEMFEEDLVLWLQESLSLKSGPEYGLSLPTISV